MHPATSSDAPSALPAPPQAPGWTWMDLLWLVFYAGLALLPPVDEIHKQLILLALVLVQIFESRLLTRWPRHGRMVSVLLKLALATLLLDHTGEVAINSSYYPIYYVPIVTAAMLYGTWETLGWTALASGSYLAWLWQAVYSYRLDVDAFNELTLRVFFFFLLAFIVNRFTRDVQAQRDLYREAAESLEERNRQLRRAQAETRRAERLAALGQLSAGLAHEIRNPLAVIKGSAEMLQKSLGPEPLPVPVELAGYISSEVDRVNLLVTRFLDFARPSRLDRRRADVISLVDRALADAAERWPNVAMERTGEMPADAVLELDVPMVERVFANLATNACEAMEGRGRLRVTVTSADGLGQPRGVSIRFSDTGPGVAAEVREQIFNPFFTTKATGVGLGLAVVAKIVDQHGGRLRLLDETEPGAHFEVFLPYADPADRG